ncbi:hypothetical protein LGH70_19835 [Hymenobacter sp. BT635]|uniref:Uncharacterized protein n=1 Tax=Hymenobacter nitidus TaxID=2880929 RepID=A0ABS8AHE5_9BACT|nr:hypothetical protein [Hymenobacter nitidus]MCB2379858.1 hypothetical protein [Hymenobacter nitidus]
MTQNIELEIKVIQRFINQSKQDRYIQFVRSTRNRRKFTADLNHWDILQADAFEYVRGAESEVIQATLQAQGVINTTCYVISENTFIDAQTLAIDEALRMTVGHGMGTILVFGNAEVVFYECETMNVRYISKPKY